MSADRIPQAPFRKVKIVGGPSPRDTKIEVDGEALTHVRGYDLSAGINQATTLTLLEYIEADIDVAAIVEEGFVAVIRTPEEIEGDAFKAWKELASGKGVTQKAALLDAINNLPGPVS